MSKVFKCYNSEGADIKVEVPSSSGDYSTAKLRKAIKPSWDPDQQSKITIYKWDATTKHRIGDPIVACNDLSTFGNEFAYELPLSEVSSRDTTFDEEGLPNKRKKLFDAKAISITFVELLCDENDAQAVTHLKDSMIKDYFKGQDPPHFCDPYMVKETFGEQELQKVLVENAAELDRTPDTEDKTKKKERILGLRLGTGFGKTHVLMKAGTLLRCTASAYLAYNQGQSTVNDEESPKKAVLLRVLLRLCKISNAECPNFFVKYSDLLKHPLLKEQLVHRMLPETTHSFFIGIDEVRLMCKHNPERTKEATSAIGDLAMYLNTKGITTTVLISALSDSTWTTISDTPIREIFIQKDSDAHAFVRSQALSKDLHSPRNYALLESVCGFHFRSIVVACQELNGGPKERNWDLHQLYEKTMHGLRFKMNFEELDAVCEFTKTVLSKGSVKANARFGLAIPFTDASGAIPPSSLTTALTTKTVSVPTNTPYKSFLQRVRLWTLQSN